MKAKVKAMAERFSLLSEHERNKKSTNLSGFLNKKTMMDDKRESLRNKDNRFAEKVSEFKDSLRSRFQTFQESLILDQQQQPKETTSVVSTDLSSNHPSTTTRSLMSKFSILLYNHDNGVFTELANNSSGFEQPSLSCNQDYGSNYLDLLLGEQQGIMMTSCNDFDIPLPFSNTFHRLIMSLCSRHNPCIMFWNDALLGIMKVQTFGIICCYLLYLSLTKTLVARFDLKNIGFGGDVNGSVGLDKSCRVGVRNCAFCGGWRFKRETGSLERRQGGKI
ncbi:hypothetical protein Bca4012_064569 [Brassica carinata]